MGTKNKYSQVHAYIKANSNEAVLQKIPHLCWEGQEGQQIPSFIVFS